LIDLRQRDALFKQLVVSEINVGFVEGDVLANAQGDKGALKVLPVRLSFRPDNCLRVHKRVFVRLPDNSIN
jgi:hypothetical protein